MSATNSSDREAQAWNMRLIGHSDLNGHGDGMQLMLKDYYLFVGHLGKMGTSILDVSDPKSPQVVRQLKNPPYTHTHKVQIAGEILVINYEKLPRSSGMPERAGIQILDISDPPNPRELGFYSTGGKGVHRVWYTGGDYAYMSATPDGYSDRILVIVDISDPASPCEASRWWIPGMWVAGGEEPSWPKEMRISAHHPVVWKDRAYLGFWDAGIIIMDISDIANPRQISRVSWAPDDGGNTHTGLPLPDRNLLIVTDESTEPNCQESPRRVRVLDIGDESRPHIISMFPQPAGDFCERGLRFGPHNVHENRPDSFNSDQLIFVTYFNAGLRVVDISRPEAPQEVAFYVPRTPDGQEAIQTNDVFVAENGLVYISDRISGGVDILEMTI
jgi:hypothetical protein